MYKSTIFFLTLIVLPISLFANTSEPVKLTFPESIFKIDYGPVNKVKELSWPGPLGGKHKFSAVIVYNRGSIDRSLVERMNSEHSYYRDALFQKLPSSEVEYLKYRKELLILGNNEAENKRVFDYMVFYSPNLSNLKLQVKLFLQNYLKNKTEYWNSTRNQIINNIQKSKLKLTALEKSLDEKRKINKKLNTEIAKFHKEYRISSDDLFFKVMGDYHKQLLDLNIEIAGSKTKLEIINEKLDSGLKSGHILPSVSEYLLQAQIAEQIQLSGFQAKHKTIVKYLNSFYKQRDNRSDQDHLLAEIRPLESDIQSIKDKLKNYEKKLNAIPCPSKISTFNHLKELLGIQKIIIEKFVNSSNTK